MGTEPFFMAAPLAWRAPVWDRELPAFLLCAVAFLALFVASEAARRRLTLPIEATRKGVHVGAGLVTLALPHLFQSLVTLVVLALAFFGVMWTTRRLGLLSSVHRVDRKTSGALIYPFGICALVLLSKGRPIVYELPLLVMVLADPAACLGGITWGRHPYAVFGQRRTVEGSATFFIVAFVVSVLLLVGRAGMSSIEAVAVGAVLAGALVFVEAWSVDGWDNFTIPIAGFAVLAAALSVSRVVLIGAALHIILVGIVAASVIVFAVRRERVASSIVREVKP